MSRARYVVALAALLGSMAVAVAAAPSTARATGDAAAKKSTTTLLSSSVIKVRSSTGRTLYLSLAVDRYTASTPYSTSLEVQVSDGPVEDHLWMLDLTNRSFSYDVKTGVGTLRTGTKQIAPLGGVDLRINPRGSAQTHSCGGGNSWIKQAATLAGTVVFKTQSKAWGTVGSARHLLTFKGSSQVETEYGNLSSSCFGGAYLPACAGAVNWGSPGSDHGVFFGNSYRRKGKEYGSLDFTTTHSIPAPANASVDTDVFLNGAPAPKLTTTSTGERVLTVYGRAHSLITGSATLRSTGSPTHHRGSCRGGETTEWSGSWTNGTKPLTVHPEIGPSVGIRDQKSDANIDQDPR